MYFELDQSDQKDLALLSFLSCMQMPDKGGPSTLSMFCLSLCVLTFEPLELDPDSITIFMVDDWWIYNYVSTHACDQTSRELYSATWHGSNRLSCLSVYVGFRVNTLLTNVK